jgi:integrase
MASIRKLPSGLWNVQIRLTGHKAQTASFKTKAEAEAWAINHKLLVKMKMPTHTLYELGEKYCSVSLRGKPSQQETLDSLTRICRTFELLSLPTSLDKLNQEHINTFRLHRLSRIATATCRKELMVIARIYRWAKREFLLNIECPVDGIAMPPNGKPRNRIVERHELELLMSALPTVMATIVEVAYETAMRRSEIVKLTPRDLHLEERYLCVVDGKTGDRVVPLTRRAVAILTESSKHCSGPTAKLFPVAPHSVSTAFRRARRAVGLDEDVRLHQLRHTRITEVAKKGFNQAQIMMVSGHRDVRSVQRYTHLSVHDIIDLID